MSLLEKFEQSSLKVAVGVITGSALTVSALAAGGGLDVDNLLGYNQPSMSFDSVLAEHMDPKGYNFESRHGDDNSFEQAMSEVSNYAGGVYLVYEPGQETDAQVVLTADSRSGIVSMPSFQERSVSFDAYSDQVMDIIDADRDSIKATNADTERLNQLLDENFPLDDMSAVRVVSLLPGYDDDLKLAAGIDEREMSAMISRAIVTGGFDVRLANSWKKQIGVQTLAKEFGEQVGAYDGHTIYRLESSEMGFGCNLTMNDKTGDLTGQNCRSDLGVKKEEQIMARIDASLNR